MTAIDREQIWSDFLQQKLPSRKNEAWKYSDLSILAPWKTALKLDAKSYQAEIDILRIPDTLLLVFLNGYYMPMLSDHAKFSAQVFIGSSTQQPLMQQKFQAHLKNAIDENKYPFATINRDLYTDDFVLALPDQYELKTPVHLLSLAVGGSEFTTHPRRLIILGENARLHLFEEYVALSTAAYMTNTVTTFDLAHGAHLQYQKIQTENAGAIHMATTFVQQEKDSQVEITQFASGGLFARDDVAAQLKGAGANCKTAGFYRLQTPEQYIDHHIDIEHIGLCSQSEMLYKGIVECKAKAVFNGRLLVQSGAQKITAYQANHNLLLSNDAEVYSKPELEIYADDVKCKHGATIGQINQDALFYLRSRGIHQAEALKILLAGFADEIFARVQHPGLKARAQMYYGVGHENYE